MKPIIELVRIIAAQNASKSYCELAHHDEAGRGLLQNDDLSVVGGRESPRRLHAERSGNDRRDLPARRRIDCGDLNELPILLLWLLPFDASGAPLSTKGVSDLRSFPCSPDVEGREINVSLPDRPRPIGGLPLALQERRI